MLNLDIVHSHQMEQFLVEVCLKQQVDLDMEKNFLSYHISRAISCMSEKHGAKA